jgi:hypothetical protein
MRRIILAALVAAAVAGCTSRTDFGECIGLADDKNPALVYKLSTWNLVMGAIFFKTIVVPVVVAVDQTYCPVAKRAP